jgi:lipopolysaccharide transport system permease protein
MSTTAPGIYVNSLECAFRNTLIKIVWRWLLLLVLILLIAGLDLCIIISLLTSQYRDFTILISFTVQLLLHAAAMTYPLPFLNGKSFSSINEWNPLNSVVEGFIMCCLERRVFKLPRLSFPFC